MEGACAAGGRDRGRVEGRALRRLLLFGAPVVVAAIVASQLFVHPIVGLADNGDFGKIMAPAGLAYRTDDPYERYWRWLVVKYAIVPPAERFPGQYRSSETLLVKTAVTISRVLRPDKDFDIRILGLLHLMLLVASFALVAAATGALPLAVQAGLLGLAVFFFTDVGYVAPFNSLYSQTASLLFFFLTLGAAALALRKGRLEGGLLFLYFAAAALFVCSKPQEFVHAPLLALLGLALSAVRFRGWRRQAAAWLAAGLCAVSLLYYAAIPKRMIREIGLYHTVFMELLPQSPDPAADLDELGLDRGLLRYSGINAYQPESPVAIPEFHREFFDRCGYGKVLALYLRHPRRLFARLERAGRLAFQLRPGSPGNFDRRAGFPPQARSGRFSAWSSLRAKLGGRGGLSWIVALFAASLVTAARIVPDSPRGRRIRWALVVVALMTALEFVVCAMADYLGDVSRHLYVFEAMWDVLLLGNLAAIAAALHRRPKGPFRGREALEVR